MDKDNKEGYILQLRNTTESLFLEFYFLKNCILKSKIAVVQNTWNDITITYDGFHHLQLYHNKELVDCSHNTELTEYNPNMKTYFGGSPIYHSLPGKVKEICVYDRELAEFEIVSNI